MKNTGSVLALVFGSGLLACSHQNTQTVGAQSAQVQSFDKASCAISQLPGARATVADTDDGVAITFTGRQRDVDVVRRDVQAMSDANDKQGSPFAMCPCQTNEPMPGGPMASAGTPSMQMGTPAWVRTVPASTRVEETSTGAVLTLRARDASQMQALRDSVRSQIRSMEENGCLSSE